MSQKSNLEFIEDTHQYLLDGVLIPCVSDIINYYFPDLYSGIPKSVLNNKASYGIECHKAIEELLIKDNFEEIINSEIDQDIKDSIAQFQELRKDFTLKVHNIECAVHYEDIYAGTYDIGFENNYLADIKTTARLHVNNETLNAPLNLQLSLYYLAKGIYKEKGYAIWLPKKKKAKIVEVKTWPKEILLELIEEFKNEKQKEQEN